MSNTRYKEIKHNSIVLGLAEYLFLILPFIVIALIRTYQNDFDGFLSAPEWSLTAAILFGQALIKLVGGVTKSSGSHWQRVVLIVSVIIVIGLTPSLIILALIMVSQDHAHWLLALQYMLFIMGSLAFVFLGAVGNMLIESPGIMPHETDEDTPNK